MENVRSDDEAARRERQDADEKQAEFKCFRLSNVRIVGRKGWQEQEGVLLLPLCLRLDAGRSLYVQLVHATLWGERRREPERKIPYGNKMMMAAR
jgi:hypothetical protein